MKRKFPARRASSNLQWSDVSGQWVANAVAATGSAVLIQLQSPTNLSNLTADPPEDLTLLRLVGDFSVQLSASVTPVSWTLALTVADVTWGAGATVAIDNDKRLLWQMTYEMRELIAVVHTWQPPGHLIQTATATVMCPREAVHIDIQPRVKVEAGKALYLVYYENAGAATLTTQSVSMRLLYKRSGRR